MTTNTNTITADAAGTWQLGDLTVNRLGFGAMRIPGREHAVEVLRTALDLGVNHIDSAAFYFSPLSSANELINRALRPYPDGLVLTTKVGPGRDPSGAFLPEARPEQLRGQVEENLRQLGRDHLDVVNLRIGTGLDRGAGSLADRFGALADLQREGLVRHLGISNVGPEHLAEARAIAPVVCVQNQYGLQARREDDALLAECGRLGIAFVPFFAIASGEEHPEVAAVARARGVTPAQVRLAWTLAKGPNVLAIPGTGDPAHLVQNVAAAGLELSDEEFARLDSI
ncbi:aldo/keto reductase [Amycolatopsis minnesotensis]|uniref:Oxidoreductase n=1 Tax=Amycolatopsis minnesotensis TaxID=337894 RepID=A0ABN2S4U7_9PSEU